MIVENGIIYLAMSSKDLERKVSRMHKFLRVCVFCLECLVCTVCVCDVGKHRLNSMHKRKHTEEQTLKHRVCVFWTSIRNLRQIRMWGLSLQPSSFRASAHSSGENAAGSLCVPRLDQAHFRRTILWDVFHVSFFLFVGWVWGAHPPFEWLQRVKIRGGQLMLQIDEDV